MRRARRLPLRLVRATSLCVCLALILTSLAPIFLVSGKGPILSQEQSGQESNSKARKVKAEPPRRGAPAANLPNLDDVRQRRDSEPEAPAPIPSTVRSKRKPAEPERGRKPVDSRPPEGRRARSYSTGGRSEQARIAKVEQVSTERRTAHSHHARSSHLLVTPLPQGGRINVARASNGGTATAQNYTQDGVFSGYHFYPSSAIDGQRYGHLLPSGGDVDGFWRDEHGLSSWLQVDFSGAKTIDEVDVLTFANCPDCLTQADPSPTQTFTSHGVTAFEAQYWTGSAWETVPGGQVTGNNLVWKKINFTAVTTTRIRVVVNASPDSVARIVEVEAWGYDAPATPGNVALASNGGTATAQNYTQDGVFPGSHFQPAFVNDGQRYCHLTATDADGFWRDEHGLSSWLQVDFNGSKTIDEVDVFTIADYPVYLTQADPSPTQTFAGYGTTSFNVQYWTGSAWETVPGGQVTGNNLVWKKLNFTAVTTTRIRVVVNASPDSVARIVELEAWQPGSGNDRSAPALARLDPFNQPGNQLQARDAEWTIPLFSLPGRAGLDLGLELSYSSLVWTRAGNYIYFDEDRGTPSPGFRLGFPTVQGVFFDTQAGVNARLLITSSSRRVELRQVGTSNVYEAADSSYLQLIDYGSSLLVRSTDGTRMSYAQFGDQWHCTQIEDRNGNLISVNYNGSGDITNITDTLGRVINFNYDPNANLNSITQNGRTQPWATFGWGDPLTMHPNLSGAAIVGTHEGEAVPVLRQVGFDDSTYCKFTYNGLGQVTRITHYASDSNPLTDSHPVNYTAYDYDSPAGDCPRLSQTRVWAENWTGLNGVPSEVVTQYSGEPSDTWRQLVAPDGTILKEFYGTGWQKGLNTQSEVWSGGVRQKWTTTAWTQDNTGVSYQTNPRVTETNVYDSSGNRRRTTIDYGQYAQYGLPYLVKEYAADGATEIRRSYTDYNLSQAFLDRRIIGLVSASHMSNVAEWQTKITYTYDDPTKIQSQATSATQHDQSYSASFTTRGNVTSVSRWDAADIDNATKVLTTQVGYNAAGSVLTTADPLAHQSSISYADSFSDGNNGRNTFAYPTTVTDADGFSSTLQYNYDFGAKTRAQGPPPAGQSQGVIQTIAYDSASRIQQVTTTNTGAYKRYIYGPNYVQSFSSVNNVADDAYAISVFDGAGRSMGTVTNHPGSAGGYSMVNVIYDQMGRAVKQSNPIEINGSWVPSGDDAGGVLYTQQSYDWKGRPLVTTHPDGTEKYASYGGCGCAGGEVVTLTDEVGREQKVYSDVLGRTWKTEVLNDDDSVYSASVNVFNARDQVVKVKQYSGPAASDASSTNAEASCPTGTCQASAMGYDGYGRLLTKHVPEQQVDPNNSASTDHTTWAYNTDDTIQSVTDARGASATYGYNARHLVTGISYSAPAGITPTSNVSFGYDAVGNRSSMTDGLGSQSYAYDQLSRMTSETRTFSVGSYTLGYGYNLAGQLTGITDPFNATINYGHDPTGRISSVTGVNYSTSQFINSVAYRASGAPKQVAYGNGRALSMNYNSRLAVTHFEIPGVMAVDYQFNNDGRLGYSHDLNDNRFDRGYQYDHAGRISLGLSGPEARGEPSSPDRPYRQFYGYDAFDHLTNRTTKHWSKNFAYISVDYYTNNRRDGWQYDAEGNLTSNIERQYTYDAAGRMSFVSGGSLNQYFDGDGQRVKTTEPNAVTYYVKSTVLDGKVIADLDSSGNKQIGYAYVGGKLLAETGVGYVGFVHKDASGVSIRKTNSVDGNAYEFTELDPLGSDAEMEDPYLYDPGYDGRGEGGPLYPGFGNITDPSRGCTQNGVYGLCDWGANAVGGISTAFWGSRIADLPGFGTNWGSFAELGLWEYERRVAYTQLQSGVRRPSREGMPRGTDHLEYLPQDTLQSRHQMTPEDVAKLRKEIKNLLQGKCKELVEEMNKRIKGGVFSNDLLDVFDYMDLNHTLVRDDTIGRGGSGGGNAVDGKPFKAGMTLNFHWFQSPAWVSLEELTHANGTAGVQYISHENMAQAAIDAAQFLKIDLNRLKNTTSPKAEVLDPKTGDSKNSQLFQAILSLECK